jgi:hypothetical protein
MRERTCFFFYIIGERENEWKSTKNISHDNKFELAETGKANVSFTNFFSEELETADEQKNQIPILY